LAVPTTLENLIETVKQSVGSETLDKLPAAPGEATSALGKALQSAELIFLGGLLALPAAGLIARNRGFLGRIGQTLMRRRTTLERLREQEMNRLLNLFKDDPDKALSFALPLASTGLSRGRADNGAQLSQRNPLFNLSLLGGGAPSSTWVASNELYTQLRNRYLEMARSAIARRDFQKAAYIYAHLLADLPSAANVLKQGKFYREATAIYRDHLKNPIQAAACLEEGGLLQEAAVLYLNQGRYLKAGDLYEKIGNAGRAQECWRKEMMTCKDQKNWVGAAEIQESRLKDPQGAAVLLLDGWRVGIQHKECLRAYFQLSGRRGSHEEVLPLFERWREEGISSSRLRDFAEIMAVVANTYPDHRVREEAVDLTLVETARNWQKQPTKDAIESMGTLFRLAPEDFLLSRDCIRFKTQTALATTLFKRVLPPPIKNVPQPHSRLLQLPAKVAWRSVVSCLDSFLAAGMAGSKLQMEYGDWAGHFRGSLEWQLAKPATAELCLLHREKGLTAAFLPHLPLQPRTQGIAQLPEIEVGMSDWLPDDTIAVARETGSSLAVLRYTPAGISINLYQTPGRLASTHPLSEMLDLSIPTCFFLRREEFFIFNGGRLLKVGKSPAGEMETTIFDLFPEICHAAAAPSFSRTRFVVSTRDGCAFLPMGPGDKPIPERFAMDMVAPLVAFTNNGDLVVAGAEPEARVYSTNGGVIQQRGTLVLPAPNPVAMTTTSIPSGIALLYADGKLAMWDSVL
jgi:tetratricopeptide (TPR) repeat protein